MMFRNDLYQADRRIERAEQELVQARADRDHLAGAPSERVETIRPQRLPLPIRHHLDLLEWWPVVATPLLAVIAVIATLATDDLDTWADFPLTWVFGSGILGGTLYSIDVLLRWTRGDRTVLNRLIIVLACIAGAPALLCGFLLVGGLMGYVAPIAVVLFLIGWVIHWIARG